MIQLHRSTVILLILLAASAGGYGSFYHYRGKLDRIQEERDGYYQLSLTTVETSKKALIFAEDYQLNLDKCLRRILVDTSTSTASSKSKFVGGVGGPLDGR